MIKHYIIKVDIVLTKYLHLYVSGYLGLLISVTRGTFKLNNNLFNIVLIGCIASYKVLY